MKTPQLLTFEQFLKTAHTDIEQQAEWDMPIDTTLVIFFKEEVYCHQYYNIEGKPNSMQFWWVLNGNIEQEFLTFKEAAEWVYKHLYLAEYGQTGEALNTLLHEFCLKHSLPNDKTAYELIQLYTNKLPPEHIDWLRYYAQLQRYFEIND